MPGIPGNPPGSFGMRRPPPIIVFIIFRACSNSLSRAFTSAVVVPEPRAIRRRLSKRFAVSCRRSILNKVYTTSVRLNK